MKTDKYGVELKFGDSVIIDDPDTVGLKFYGPQNGEIYRIFSGSQCSQENSGIPADVFEGCVYLDGDWAINCKRIIKVNKVFCGELKYSYDLHSGFGLEI